MFFSSKPIAFVRKPSIITRNQRSLFRLVQNLLDPAKYDVMYARPAYHVFDADERNNSSSNLKKGREMVANAYLDIIVLESETLKPVCAFRMDTNGHKQKEDWSRETQNLVMAAESARFPLFVVPVMKTYPTAAIRAKLKRVVSVRDVPSQDGVAFQKEKVPGEEDGRDVDHHRREVKTYHKTRP